VANPQFLEISTCKSQCFIRASLAERHSGQMRVWQFLDDALELRYTVLECCMDGRKKEPSEEKQWNQSVW